MDRADTRLWHGWRTQGDSHAFEALVRPHLEFATDFARRVGCRPDQADDVVQEALVRLAQEESERPVEVGLRAWIGRTISLQARMLRRSEGRRAKREQAHVRPARDADGPVSRYPEVERAVATLPPGQRQAVILRYRHDLEYREIARILGISENAARLRVHKAMGEMRTRFGKNAGPLVAALPLLPGGGRSGLVKAALAAGTASSGTGLVLGALAVKTLVISAAVVVLGGLAAFLVTRSDDPEPVDRPPIASADHTPEPDASAEEPTLAPAPRPTDAHGTRPVVPPRPPPPASNGAAAVLERLLAKGARLSYGARGDYEGTRHRLTWVKQGDALPDGLPSGIRLAGEGVGELLSNDVLLRALHYVDASGEAFDDQALDRLAQHAELLVLRLNHTAVTDEGLRALTRVPSLRTLTLDRSRVGDEGMRHLAGLSNLVWLDVRGSHVTDAGMAHLGGLARLEKFEFGGTAVTDAGLKHLRGAPLRVLNLEKTRVTGAGVKHLDLSKLVEVEAEEAGTLSDALLESLRGAPLLEVLVLKETGITDAGLVHLRTLPSLKELDLNDTRVTDVGLRVLLDLEKLEDLSLRDTSVTDRIVDVLAELESLEKVNLSDTRVTKAGVARLQEARPKLRIRGP